MKLFNNILTVVYSPTVLLCATFFGAIPTNAANLAPTSPSQATYSIKIKDTNNNSAQNVGIKKFLSNIQLAQAITVRTVFTTQTPSTSKTDNRPYELGMKFRTTTDGQINAIRYWKPAGETATQTSPHIGKIWSASGTLLASVTFSPTNTTGWQKQTLSTPLNIKANTTYVVSVNANSHYAYSENQLSSAIANNNISSVADGNNGVYNLTRGSFPNSSYRNSNYFRDVDFVAAQSSPTPTPTPTPTPAPTPTTSWKERILNADGTINWTEYTNVANNYHKREMIDYRFGPKYSDFHTTAESFPTVYQPSSDGIIRKNAGAWCRVNPGTDGDPGAAWMTSGQMLFSPDADAPAEYRFGSSNMRNSDGVISFTDNGLCLRARSEWIGDWWNRNNISTPTTPAVKQYYDASGGTLPLPPVATARGVGGTSVTGYLAFQNGLIGIAGTGNDPYTSEGFSYVSAKLDAGKVPTAMTVTNNNEFVLVTVWDTINRKGQVAVVAVKGNQMGGAKRFYWGIPSWPTVKGLKVIGYVDLPFAAPNAIDVTVSTVLSNPRGDGSNYNDDLNLQSVRDLWYNRVWDDVNNNKPKQTAQSGYVIVSSRAENKVAFIDLRPLLKYYRKMTLTTQSNFDQTKNEGTSANQWPYTFSYAPEQTPVVSKVLTINQPTSVATGNWYNTAKNPRSQSFGEERKPLMTAYIAAMDGTVRMYDVQSLIYPNATAAVPDNPFKTFQVGKNPVQMFHGFYSTSNDDLYIVSRGDRAIYYTFYNGTVNGVLRDSRLIDPVSVAVSTDGAGFGGSGPGKAMYSNVMSVMDFSGKQVVSYMVNDGFNWNGERIPFIGPNGENLIFMHGFSNPVKGNPFMATFDEVI